MIRKHLEQLEARENPATVDLAGGVLTFTGGSANDTLTVSLGSGNCYNFNDTQAITLGSGAIAVGWKGGGTSTVAGYLLATDAIEIDTTGGADSVAIKATANPITVNAAATSTGIAISSNGVTLTGTLDTIQAPINVVAVSGSVALVVSDASGTDNSNASIVGAVNVTTVSGFAPADISFSGAFAAVRLIGRGTGSGQSFTFDSVASPMRLDAGNAAGNVVTINGSTALLTINGGNNGNTFSVLGDAVANLTGGYGSDVFYVAPGVTLTGSIHGRNGGDTFDIQGVVTGGVYVF